ISQLKVITGSFFSLFNFQGPLCFAKKFCDVFIRFPADTFDIIPQTKAFVNPFFEVFSNFLRSFSPPFWRVNYNTTSLFKMQVFFGRNFRFYYLHKKS
ncbi:MAG: hypothetical protein II101_02490, partial [Ruminococcus sp.]|nr:hypothetical protein [Ruminococcus sp.]